MPDIKVRGTAATEGGSRGFRRCRCRNIANEGEPKNHQANGFPLVGEALGRYLLRRTDARLSGRTRKEPTFRLISMER